MATQQGLYTESGSNRVIGGQFVPMLVPWPLSFAGLTVGENIYGPNGNGGGGMVFDSCHFQGSLFSPAPLGYAGSWVITVAGSYNVPDSILTLSDWASYYAEQIVSLNSPQGCAT